jgi:NAD(P)-dependent dehydrogenase (short-subunit alcohol dehydrogenase family)
MGNLEGKGIAVTGGAGDIGAAMGAEFAWRGATVTLIDRKASSEAEPWLERARRNGKVRYAQADVRDRSAFDRVLAGIEPLDGAIGNAGIVEAAPFLEITERQWQDHLDINLTGCFHLAQSAARLMMERGRPGLILFTGSWVQEVPWPEIAAYSASKAGIRMLARSAALELAPSASVSTCSRPASSKLGWLEGSWRQSRSTRGVWRGPYLWTSFRPLSRSPRRPPSCALTMPTT